MARAHLLSRRKLAWRTPGAINQVSDGNSITQGNQDGSGSVGGVMTQLYTTVSPFTLQTQTNVAIGGQTTTNMINSYADVLAAFVPGKFNILFAQELTNSGNTGITAAENTQLFLDYLALMRSLKAWDLVICATAPPVYLGDTTPDATQDDYNARLDASNALLRTRFAEQADALFETRQSGSPYDQARYPNYRRATFFDTTVINGISNNAAWTNEGSQQTRIHYSAAGIAALKPFVASWLLRLSPRRGT